MIQVISKMDGYWKGGRSNPAHPVYFEEGYLTQAEIDGYLASAWTPQSKGKPIYISFGVDEPKGEGWIIYRAAERNGAQAKESITTHPPIDSAPMNAPAVVAEPVKRGRPFGSGKK